MEEKTIAIFDMDLVAYRSAAAVEKRTVNVIHKATGKQKEFKTRTEFKAFLESKGINFDPDFYEITDVQTPEEKSHAFALVKKSVKSICQQVWADDLEGYIGGSKNFRLDLDLPVEYKYRRKDMLRPVLLKETKDYILNKYPGGIIDGIEVDDYVIIRWHELKSEGKDPIVISLDKDSKGCVGVKLFNWTDDNPEIVEVPVLGHIQYDSQKKKADGLGLKFYCYQLLKGDNSDDYSPSDLHGKRFGDVGAIKIIQDTKTVDELFSAVESQFKRWFPDPITYKTHKGTEVTKNYKEILEMYHLCVYMQRKRNDTTGFYDLWEEFKGKE